MIPRTLLLAALIGLMSGCAVAQREPAVAKVDGQNDRSLTVIKIDTKHLASRQSDGSEAPAYVIRSHAGFILDASGYEFAAPFGSANNVPSVIQLIVDQRGLYETPWQTGVERYSLTASTLVPKSGSVRFGGFKRGERLILCIGREQPAAQAGQTDFFPLWAGAIDVQ